MHFPALVVTLLCAAGALLLATGTPLPGGQGTPTNLSAPIHISGSCTWQGKAPICKGLCSSAYPNEAYRLPANASSTADAFGSGPGPVCAAGEKALCCTAETASRDCHIQTRASNCLSLVLPYTPSSSASPTDPDAPLFLGSLNATLPACTNTNSTNSTTESGQTLLMRELDVVGLYGFNNGHTGAMWMTCERWEVRDLCCAGS